jgi:lipopolysaccharide heptosyltransferase I
LDRIDAVSDDPSPLPERILIVRLSALGDVIHVLPSLTALRRAIPHAHIGWMVEDRAASLLADHPQLDRVHVVPRKALVGRLKKGRVFAAMQGLREITREVRREGYQVALDFQSNFRSGGLSRSSGAPRRLSQHKSFAKEGASTLFATETPPAVAPDAHKIVRNLSLVAALGVPIDPVPAAVLPESAAARDAAEVFAAEPGPRAILQAGVSAFGALKAWPEEHFAALARGLLSAGVHVFFGYGPGEKDQAERLVAAAPGSLLTPPTQGLLSYAAVLRGADLFVGVDSGPLHLAATLGTPVLGLYGPKHPGTYGPYWPGTRVVRAGIECSPCRYRRCPRPDVAVLETPEGTARLSPCMLQLPPDAALSEALALLGPRLGDTSTNSA